MAKKRRGRKKKAPEVVNKHELPGGFWRQVVAFLMIVFAVLLVVSWFGDSGGKLLSTVRDFMLNLIGWTYYLLPAMLVYLSVLVFRAPDNRIDPPVTVSSILMLFWFSCIFGAPGHAQGVAHGGILGVGVNDFVLDLVDLPVAILIYVVLALITAMFMFASTPAELFRKIGAAFSTKETKEDAKNARVIRRTRGAAIEDEESRPLPKLKIRNTTVDEPEKKEHRGILAKKPAAVAEKPVAKEPETALVAISDPDWKMPPFDLLERKKSPADSGNIEANAAIIRETLAQFGIDIEVENANVGPRITQYTFRPPQGVKIAKIATYDRELSLNLAKDKIRIEAPIPGTRSVGIEIPNDKAASVGLHELLRSAEWRHESAEKPLAFALGKDISGKVIIGNLAKMPHLLIAGTTGSGKSVMTNTLIMSMLYHNSPADLRFIIIDPKQVEMAAYNDIPHLLTPVITQVDKSLSALKWAVGEMERRYALMAEKRVKNIIDYNKLMAKTGETTPVEDEDGNVQQHDGGKMPYIVVVVDEMADLMMMAGKELEVLIVRIAQKGRAAGMHLVLATQRPEVKVVTGLIKANIPGRIAFAVNNGVDSRVMLDKMGAEKLLGQGDMLYLTTEMMGKPLRVQGAFVSDAEIGRVTDFLRAERAPQYNEEVISQSIQIKGMPSIDGGGGDMGSSDDLIYNAAKIAVESGKVSTSLLQRRLGIGYGKAARVIDDLETMGVVGPAPGGNRPREILIGSMDEFPGNPV